MNRLNWRKTVVFSCKKKVKTTAKSWSEKVNIVYWSSEEVSEEISSRNIRFSFLMCAILCVCEKTKLVEHTFSFFNDGSIMRKKGKWTWEIIMLVHKQKVENEKWGILSIGVYTISTCSCFGFFGERERVVRGWKCASKEHLYIPMGSNNKVKNINNEGQ